MKKKERVVVGMSGGVDSSVAAYLIQKSGYEVIGIFMKNWTDDSVTISEECPWVEDSNDALMVANQLGIPFQTLDFTEAYRERIVNYMFAEYERGRTPNPDVLCNREIKFDVFLQAAQQLGADYVATGHYCRKDEFKLDNNTIFRLLSGKDQNKDQSYFLCQINQEQLAKALFPIGELSKTEVRKIAQEQGFTTAEKKDSQGLCFIGKVKLPVFLQQQLASKEGHVIEIPKDHSVYQKKKTFQSYEYEPSMGKKIGTHIGAHFFTIGQRKGLNIGGKTQPLYVIGTDVDQNLVYVGEGDLHPGLYRSSLFVKQENLHWLRPDLKMEDSEKRNYKARVRYRQTLQSCLLHKKSNGLYVTFNEAQRGITPGQFFAWYQEDELLGSGIID